MKLWVITFEFQDLLYLFQRTIVPCAVVRRCLRDPVFRVFNTRRYANAIWFRVRPSVCPRHKSDFTETAKHKYANNVISFDSTGTLVFSCQDVGEILTELPQRWRHIQVG